MKKIIFSILLLPVLLMTFSYSSGAPFGYSGSQGDRGRSCTYCHSFSGTAPSPNIQLSGLPSNGYVPGQTYNLTLDVSNVSNTKTGFEATAEDAANQKTGTFANTDGNTQAIQSNTYITHTSAGTALHNWSFNWTAPDAGTGDVKLYYVVNIANGDGNTTGDYIANNFESIPEQSANISELTDQQFSIYPNPADDYIKFSSHMGKIKNIEILDVLGKTYRTTSQNNQIDVSFLPTGNYLLRLQTEKLTGIKHFIKK